MLACGLVRAQNKQEINIIKTWKPTENFLLDFIVANGR